MSLEDSNAWFWSIRGPGPCAPYTATKYRTYLKSTLSARGLWLETIEYEACLGRHFCTARISYERNFTVFLALSVEDLDTQLQLKPYYYYYYIPPPSNEPVARTLPSTLIVLFTKFWTTHSMTHTFGKYCKWTHPSTKDISDTLWTTVYDTAYETCVILQRWNYDATHLASHLVLPVAWLINYKSSLYYAKPEMLCYPQN